MASSSSSKENAIRAPPWSPFVAGPPQPGPAMSAEEPSAWSSPVFAAMAALNSSAVINPALRAMFVAVAEPEWSTPSPSRSDMPPDPDQVLVVALHLACQMPNAGPSCDQAPRSDDGRQGALVSMEIGTGSVPKRIAPRRLVNVRSSRGVASVTSP